MSSVSTFARTSAAAAMLVLPVTAHAEQHEVTSEAVTAYFEQIREEATELVRAQELGRMVEWIERHIADGAVLQATINVVHGEESKGFATLTLDRNDMLRVSRVFAGMFQQQPIKDYSLAVEIIDVVSHGPGAVTARVRWRESMAFDPGAAGEKAADGGAEAGQLTIEEVVDCSHVVQRADDDRLTIGLSTCTGELRLQ